MSLLSLSANHGNSLERALDTLAAAKAAGAEAVKLQTYTPDTMTLDVDHPDFVIKGGLWDGRRLYDLYREAQTPLDWHEALFDKARALGIDDLLDTVRRDRGRFSRNARRARLQDRVVRAG